MIKTAELTGAALDWAVATIEGHDYWRDGKWTADVFTPSTDWAQGGPIIERCEIGVRRYLPAFKGGGWEATPSISAKGAGGRSQDGPTPLIAAMRCYVASNLGDEVDIPEELL